ncbi:MAG: XdhC/CoxI family protein [Anaerolineae bacterium]|jgi:xanthine dehydrogenase accessory factor
MSEELQAVYEAILEALRSGKMAAVATVVETGESTPRGPGAKALIFPGGRIVGTVGGGDVEAHVIDEACMAMAEGRPREVLHAAADACGQGMRILIEVLPTRPTLVIVGAGHVGQAVAELGAFLGYRVVVVDERAALVTAERFPDAASRIAGDPTQRLADLPLDDQTFVVIVTPHQSPDEQILAALADRQMAYIGLMGGRRRTEQTFRRAQELGVREAFLERIHTPIGLDIDAETPREIAVSILAQIIELRRGQE